MADEYDETPLNPALQYRQAHTQEETERAFPPSVDYRSLLVKYIRLVRSIESVDYIDNARASRQRLSDAPGSYRHDEDEAALAFTDTEWAELQRLAGEAPRG